MAEDLDDGEFWLPSHFLTDDDILMDFDFSTTSITVTATTHGGSSSSTISDLDFASVAESDEDDILNLHHLSLHQSSCPLHLKGCGGVSGGVLSSSPQSTLCGCLCNQSSSRESASPPPPPPPGAEEKITTTTVSATGAVDNSTLNLLNKAAGEVARLKMMTENNNSNKKVGTGFFDCSKKGVSYPPPPIKNPPMYFHPRFIHFPPMVYPAVQYKYNQPKQNQHHQNKATKSDNKSNTTTKSDNKNRPLGLPLSAWPPLQAQSQAQPEAQPQPQAQPKQLPPLFVGPPKGTGVFLPRVVTPPANETRKKSDGNATKSKTGKCSQTQSNNHRRNSGKISTTTMTTTNHNDIQLPQEWIY